MKPYAFGVDIGGTFIKMGLFTTDGKLLDSWELPTRIQAQGGYILGDIADAVNKKLAERNLSKRDVEGIGVGIPGPIRTDGVVLRCVNLGWGVFNVEQELSRLTGLKARAGNDANVAALGEMWQGGGKGHQNIVMVTLGTGVGGGTIVNGKILTGFHGAAGEIGHIPVCDEEEEACGCGKHGCLEQYASASGMAKMTKRYLAQHPEVRSDLAGIENCTAKEIFEKAALGDAVALHMVDRVGYLLGKALASIACMMDPEVFIIGGGMSRAGELLIGAVRKWYKHYAFHACRETEFKLARLGNRAGIYGGVKMVLE